jgi:PAS domain S-box-containing protein
MIRSVLAVGGTAIASTALASLLRRRAAANAGELGDPYRILFQHNPLPMFVIDDDSRELLHVNGAAVRAYGYDREELMAMTFDVIRADVDRHRRRRGVTVYRHKDVTDRVLAERRLRKSRETLRRTWLTKDGAQRTHIPCAFQAPAGNEVDIEPAERAVHVFRVVQEALTNAARHGAPGAVSVRVSADGDAVVVSVEDDGRGFDVDEANRHVSLGIVGMRERAHLLSGTLDIVSTAAGPTVVLRFPRMVRTEPA